jgi:hypothetical protein
VDYQITPPTPAELTGICDSLRAAQVKWAAVPLAHRVEVMLRWDPCVRDSDHNDPWSRRPSVPYGKEPA